MPITSTLNRMTMAEKLSIPQLQQAIQNGTIPAYMGIPLLQDKMQMEQHTRNAAQMGQDEPPPIAEQILAQANQYGGIDALPSGLPQDDGAVGMAGGGIVAFASGGATGAQYVNPRTNQPYTRDEVQAGLPAQDAQAERSARYGNVWGGVKDAVGGIEVRGLDADADARANILRDSGPTTDQFQRGPNPYGQAMVGARRQITSDEVGGAIPPHLAGRYPDDAPESRGILDGIKSLFGPSDRKVATPPPPAPTPAAVKAETPDGGKATETAGSKGGGTKLIDVSKPAANPKQAVAQVKEAGQQVEKDPSALEQYTKMLMDERGKVGDEREHARGMAILQAGLAMMAGTSPNAFKNIGEGAMVGVQTYEKLMSDVSKRDSDRIKSLINLGATQEQLAMEAQKIGISERQLEATIGFNNARIGLQQAMLAAKIAGAGVQQGLTIKPNEYMTRVQAEKKYLSGLADFGTKTDAEITAIASANVDKELRKLGVIVGDSGGAQDSSDVLDGVDFSGL